MVEPPREEYGLPNRQNYIPPKDTQTAPFGRAKKIPPEPRGNILNPYLNSVSHNIIDQRASQLTATDLLRIIRLFRTFLTEKAGLKTLKAR
jgi:hypothetical protein